MANNEGISSTGPWQSQILKVDERARLRLPRQLATAVSWLASSHEDVSCLAMVGLKGGIVLCPLALLAARLELMTGLSSDQFRRTAAGSEILDYARYAATSWPVTISFEAKSSRYAFYLPEGARKLGLVPNNGERAVVFAAGEILEVWTAPDWIAYLRRVGGNIGRLEQAILQELQSGESED